MLYGLLRPPPVKLSAIVKSSGCAVSAGENGGVAVDSAYSAAMFDPGLWAMLIAAVAVSVGAVPLDPADFAFEKSVEQAVKLGPVELIQAASIFASVLISLCGTVPFPAGVVASTTPVEIPARFAEFSNALAMPINASAVPELD